ncbi:hypothetical protein CN497_22695 [Priestia megaterium]|uniref:Uncharacterized protein n=1 Tax=Priestia megaterium TaxID=1404 RepID=A0AAE5P444_PRIMG|nr:hypothetical protein CN497_22695 [Priestia megaterium]
MHAQAKESLAEPYCRKGSFAWFRKETLCQLQMYTTHSLKTEKTPQAVGSFSVCYTYQYFSVDAWEHLE